MSDTPPTSFHRRCRNVECEGWVHANQKRCKVCGTASPWVDDPDAFMPHIVLLDFSTNIGIQLSTFREGQIIREPDVIRHLLNESCPIKVHMVEDRPVLCPHCCRSFLPNADREVTQTDILGPAPFLAAP